jgi:hypothetical protein
MVHETRQYILHCCTYNVIHHRERQPIEKDKIFEERVHISAWYEEADIPRNWKLSVSENSWINNTLGLEWLKHFDAHTKTCQVGAYRLLILDGHESHLNQDFQGLLP